MTNIAKVVLLMMATLLSVAASAQRQPGMVDKPGGGQVFNAEQYKIDRMRVAPAPNTSNYYRAPTNSTTGSARSTSSYDAGSAYMTNPKEWKRMEMELDYRKYGRKSKSRETEGLDIKTYGDNGIEVTHEEDGIQAYNTTVFHNHKKEYDFYNNILYDLYYSLPLTNSDDFGFGLQFIGHSSTFHECKEYTFFSFFIMPRGKLYYFKKKLPSAKTSGFFGSLQRDIPEMFRLENYTKIDINAELKDLNLLTVTQWKNKFTIAINSDIIYEDRLSRCPVRLESTPYNLFLNKGKVQFFQGNELYTEKKHF
jgi:hypothetical protein